MGRAQRFEITVEGRRHEVSVQLDDQGRPVEVRVDDASCSVQLAADDALLVSAGDGPMHCVHLTPGRRPDHAVVGGSMLSIAVETVREAALELTSKSTEGSTGSGTVEAPMPGRVVRLMVAEGDPVEHDAPLLIVEAMKMENEVRTSTAGVVRKVAVSVGDTVETGQLLVQLEPPEPKG